MKPAFLDTSCVIALLNTSDLHHDKARLLCEDLKRTRRPLLTTAAVLVELGDGFARKGRWSLITSFLAAAEVDPLLEILPVDAALIGRARALRDSRPDKDWGLTDCVSFTVMTDRGIDESLTADRHFQQASFRALLLEP